MASCTQCEARAIARGLCQHHYNTMYRDSDRGRAVWRVYKLHHQARVAAAQVGGCVDCGSELKLRFHHLDPATKAFNVSRMAAKSDEVFYAELAKCAVVCHWCHTRRHVEMRMVGA